MFGPSQHKMSGMERVITVCYGSNSARKSRTILVRDGSFVRFAILDACNALKARYDKRFGFFRPSNVTKKHFPWIHPNQKFPLIKQSEEEEFELKICAKPEYQSNLDVIRLMVKNIDDPNGKEVMVQIRTLSRCYMIPVMFRRLSRQKIKQANNWNVLINESELVDNGSRISEYDIKDGDRVSICREVEIEIEKTDSDVAWL